MGPIRNPRWEQKRTEGYVIVSRLTLEGDSGEEIALWLLTSLCTSSKTLIYVYKYNQTIDQAVKSLII
jgi:hypothetical protein